MSKPLYFDIETVPEPKEVLDRLMPEFDPAEVKLGNTRDPDKVRERIILAKAEQQQSFFDNAALHANTGKVAMIGIIQDDKFAAMITNGEKDEAKVLNTFWGLAMGAIRLGISVVGFNILEFDLPFLVRRSWKLKVHVPIDAGDLARRYPAWNPLFLDLMQLWNLGNRYPDKGTSSLNDLAKYFGLPPKLGKGKDFHKMSKEQQVAYCEQDLRLVRDLDERMRGDV